MEWNGAVAFAGVHENQAFSVTRGWGRVFFRGCRCPSGRGWPQVCPGARVIARGPGTVGAVPTPMPLSECAQTTPPVRTAGVVFVIVSAFTVVLVRGGGGKGEEGGGLNFDCMAQRRAGGHAKASDGARGGLVRCAWHWGVPDTRQCAPFRERRHRDTPTRHGGLTAVWCGWCCPGSVPATGQPLRNTCCTRLCVSCIGKGGCHRLVSTFGAEGARSLQDHAIDKLIPGGCLCVGLQWVITEHPARNQAKMSISQI